MRLPIRLVPRPIVGEAVNGWSGALCLLTYPIVILIFAISVGFPTEIRASFRYLSSVNVTRGEAGEISSRVNSRFGASYARIGQPRLSPTGAVRAASRGREVEAARSCVVVARCALGCSAAASSARYCAVRAALRYPSQGGPLPVERGRALSSSKRAAKGR
jgi:hypothetical protein